MLIKYSEFRGMEDNNIINRNNQNYVISYYLSNETNPMFVA